MADKGATGMPKNDSDFVEQVISDLNRCSGKRYRPAGAVVRKVVLARKREGFTLEDFFCVNRKMSKKWLGTQWERYVRPVTLYRASKFEGYLNEPDTPMEQAKETSYQKSRNALEAFIGKTHEQKMIEGQ